MNLDEQNVNQAFDEEGNFNIKPFPHNIRYKANPLDETWQPWFYLPPTEKTIKILKKEVRATITQMKEEKAFAVKRVCTVLYGKSVYAFKLLNGEEIYLDQ